MSMSAGGRRPLLPWLLAAMVVAGAAMAAQLGRGGLRLPLYDYTAFWAAGRLNAAGEDPYDPAKLEAREREANPELVDILVMWPAPWALTLLAPFTPFGPQASHVLWQCTQFLVLLAAVELLWRSAGGSPERRWVGWLLTFTFPPCYFLLVTGQFGAVILLGLAGFLYFLSRGRETAAGACLALAAVKPQLTFLFWIALLLWSLEGRRWRVAAGAVLAVAALLAVPLCQNPHLPVDYWVALTRRTQTHSHLSPVAGTALRLLFAPGQFWPQFVPLVPGLLWLAWYWHRHRVAWNWTARMPALLFASFLAAPYGAWPFDLVVLLLPLVGRVCELEKRPAEARRAFAAAYAAIGAAATVEILWQVEYFWFLWMTPALMALYYVAGVRARRYEPAMRRRLA